MKPDDFTRREFLKAAGYGSLSGLATALLPVDTLAAIANTDTMKITRIEAVRFSDKIHIGGGSGGSDGAEFCWIRLHTDSGLVGTGETYPYSNGELGTLKDYASELMGKDPRDIDGLWKNLYHAMAMRNAGGADMRIISA